MISQLRTTAASKLSSGAKYFTSATPSTNNDRKANIAIIGCGWWTQGWHCPGLDENEGANLMALVNTNPNPQSKLDPDMISLEDLGKKYGARTFLSLEELLDSDLAADLDGIIVATPHATHYDVGKKLMEERGENDKPLHIMMEKPMTTLLPDAFKMRDMVENDKSPAKFLLNHTANYRDQAKIAREAIESGRIGKVKHIKAMFAAPLKSVFEDPENKGWTEPSEGMDGNGFGWGQSTHLFAFLFHVCPDLVPERVYCDMVHSEATGADISFSATITCQDGAIIGASGTTLLNGDAHSDPPVGKRVMVEIYGDKGSVFFSGVDLEPKSGRLELYDEDGNMEVLHEEFAFENLTSQPESLQGFVELCRGGDVYEGATVEVGLRAVQTVEAMYRSNKTSQVEQVQDKVE